MQPVEIKKDIFWVGAVDFDKREFHGYSRCPDGTTSNAFLVRDEKSVLVDTVMPGHAGELLCRLAKIMPPDKVDYIICNHMELDHQGVLAEIVERVRPEKIFVSENGAKSFKGYFGERDWPIQVVKSGEELSLGSKKIIFQYTPMLHWPDSMVSYLPGEKLLLSNDIFGQNIASTERYVDTYDNMEEFDYRVHEYYNNIVLPYSQIVLKTLPVVEKLDIDMVAPDHGLIYRSKKDIQHIISLYRAMAEQKPQKRAVIFYDTMWDSTEKMAYAICNGLADSGVPTRIMSVKKNHHSQVMTELSYCGAMIVGSPTHNNTILPLVAAQMCYIKGLKPLNRVGAAFGSYGWSGESAKMLQTMLAEMNVELPAEPLKCNWAPTKDTFKACYQLGRTVADALIKKCAASE